jgi:hypothetical protein
VVALEHRKPQPGEVTAAQIFDYLDFAVELSIQYPEGSVLKFAAGVVIDEQFTFKSNDVYKILDYLLVLAFHQPPLLPSIATLIERYKIDSFLAAGDRIDRSLNTIILENVRQMRSDGICWGIYCLVKWGGFLSLETANEIIETEDAFGILTLYWSEQHNDLVKAFCARLDPTDLYLLDRYWILLYQLFFDGVSQNPYQDGIFEMLKNNDVIFLIREIIEMAGEEI